MKTFKELLYLFILYLISWGVTVGLVYLIFLCFEINFTLKLGTGIWLTMLLINIGIKGVNKK